MSKKGWIILGVGVLVVGGIIGAATGGGDNSKTTNQTSAATYAQVTTTSTTTAEPAKSSKISLEEFNSIKNGMTYKEVVEIIGGEGEVLSESGEEGSKYHTIMYKWDGEGGFGANANAMFQGGKLISKSQLGLK